MYEFDVEYLIELVSERPAVWDRRLKLHGNRYALEKCWREISQLMRVEELQLRKKWKYLRDQFTVEWSKRQSSNSSEDADTYRWKYFNSLLFLKDVVKTRSTYPKLCTAPGPSDEMQQHPSSIVKSNESIKFPEEKFEHVYVEEPGPSWPHFEEQEENTIASYSSIECNNQVLTSESNNEKNKRKRMENFEDVLLDIERQKLGLIAQNAEMSRKMDEEDSEDMMFLKSLLTHIQKIPDHKKLSFRSRIQEVVEEFAYPTNHTQHSYAN